MRSLTIEIESNRRFKRPKHMNKSLNPNYKRCLYLIFNKSLIYFFLGEISDIINFTGVKL